MPEKKVEKQKVSSKRILTLDLMRGFFLVSIILNHLQWYPSGFDFVAFRGSLVVSAAEGFFLISGIVLGIIRGRKLIEQPFRKAALLLFARGARLYIISIVLMLAFTFIGWLFLDNPGLKAGIRPTDQPLGEIIIGALSFQYIYGWADFLRLYAIFMIMAPFALWLLRKGKWYILLALSIAIWTLYPYAFEHTAHSAELLMVLSWQLIFFGGFIVGFYWEKLTDWWLSQTKKMRQWIAGPVLVFAALTLLINIVFVTIHALGIDSALTTAIDTQLLTIFNKEGLPLPRLITFITWFILGFYIFHRYEKKIIKWFGWILLPFGANSLYVYILHAIILFFAHLIMPPETATNIFVNAVGSAIIIGLILLAVRKHFLFKIIPR